MHRSGTSALARVCNVLGAYLPPEIVSAEPSNATGHWEPSGMVAANRKALEAIDLTWDSVEAFPQNWFDSAGTTSAEQAAAAFLKDSFEGQQLFLLKDPRACRTLPIWFRRLWHYKARPVVAMIVRNPLEVAASLKQRDGLPMQHALLLWLRYNLEAELHSRGAPRVIVTYDELLRDWESVANRIAEVGDFAWPANLHRAREQVGEFLRREHRHHRTEDESALARPEVSALVGETYSALQLLSEPGAREAGEAQLDAARRHLAAADTVLSGVIGDLSVAVRRARKAATRASWRADKEREARVASSEAAARQAARAAGLVSVIVRAIDDAEQLAGLVARTRVIARQRRGAGRWGRVGAVARCLARSTLDCLLHPRLTLELLGNPGLSLERLQARHLMRRSGLFDGDYYLENNPDIRASGADPLLHFIDHGWREGRQPSVEFDAALYLREKPEVEQAGQNPLLHMLYTAAAAPDAAALAYVERTSPLAGRRNVERRLIEASGLFDADYYARSNSGAMSGDPIVHYLRIGWKQKRGVGANFDAPWYLAKNADVAAAGLNPLLHYILHGAGEGRLPKPDGAALLPAADSLAHGDDPKTP